jgi:hypothetical protein
MLLFAVFGCIDRLSLPVEDGGLVIPCTVSPAPDDITTLRVGPGGEVFGLGSDSALYRWERSGEEECALDGEMIYDPESLQGVTDFDLTDEGDVIALVHLGQIWRFSNDGTLLYSCDVSGGHGVAVAPDGALAWVIPVGAEELAVVQLNDADCEQLDAIATSVPLSTMPVSDGETLAVGTHNAGGDLPSGVLIDVATGETLLDLANTEEPAEGRWMASMSDIAYDPDGGWWVTGSPDGDLWAIESDGSTRVRVHSDVTFSVPDDPESTFSVWTLGLDPDGPSYVAGGFMVRNYVWSLRL